MNIDTNHFKNKLEEEKTKLESELASVAQKNPDNPSDWQPISVGHDIAEADENLQADAVEAFEDNTAITNSLETRYNDVKRALDKIANGTYGICEISGEEIEADRLEANPAARTCKAHINNL
jgi:RNA polymerase-binding transcription factor DksA